MALNTAKAEVVMRGLTATFDNSAKAATPFYPKICTTAPSDGADEKYGFIGNMPGVKEWKGARQFEQLRAASFEIVNKHWESSLLVDKNDVKDDRMNMYGPLMQGLAEEAMHHPDELWFELMVGGESTACFDGQNFYDTDHEWGDSGAQSNDLTYDATDPDAVTVAEFKAAYHQARQALLGYRRDNGKLFRRPVVGGMKDLLLIVPLALESVAWEAIYAELTGGGNTNVVIDKPVIETSAMLTSGRKFYLHKLGEPLRPFVWQPREPLSRDYKGLDDIEVKHVKFMTEARYNMGYLAWWNSVLTTFN